MKCEIQNWYYYLLVHRKNIEYHKWRCSVISIQVGVGTYVHMSWWLQLKDPRPSVHSAQRNCSYIFQQKIWSSRTNIAWWCHMKNCLAVEESASSNTLWGLMMFISVLHTYIYGNPVKCKIPFLANIEKNIFLPLVFTAQIPKTVKVQEFPSTTFMLNNNVINIEWK